VSDLAQPVELATELLRDAFGRVREDVAGVLAGLDVSQLLWRPDPGANSIAWLVWHLSRIQDDHLAGITGHEQRWTSEGWYERFALPYAVRDHGYGHRPGQVGAFVLPDPGLLAGYHGAVHDATLAALNAMAADDYTRIVDWNWKPPVTAAVRIISVVNDTMQHAGQAAYVRGLLQRRGTTNASQEAR